ncbi:MAG: DUF368 domain-containing protein [Gammaproteobacteria bacterium]|nr:DUF368 domain-containing protein [Gammaproteobacteria bacterium]
MTDAGAPGGRDAGAWTGILVRGAAMGVAEVVPGVSGGTIAFVTGIYRELIASLAAFSPKTLPWLVTDPRLFWRHHNLGFLACLGSGMLVSVLLLARAITAAIETVPTLVWGFFFGLVLFSVFDIGRARPPVILSTLGVAGLLLGAATGLLDPVGTDPTYPAYFLGGALAVCAWLLPAVSGSFLLVVLGLYADVLAAAASLNLPVLAVFVLGMATGIALFARLLKYLMDRFVEPVLGFLTGFMAGALVNLWPWQAGGALLSPGAWSETSGSPARVGLTLAMMIAGAVALWLLARLRFQGS